MVIPNTCKCIWCNGTMERRGITQTGHGINTFSLWCNQCGAVVIHVRHSNKKIDQLDTTIKYREG